MGSFPMNMGLAEMNQIIHWHHGRLFEICTKQVPKMHTYKANDDGRDRNVKNTASNKQQAVNRYDIEVTDADL